MRSAVTLSRVAESAAGPFVFHDDLETGFQKAATHGFDAVELFLPGPETISVEEVKALQNRYGLAIAAVGTGAGMLRHGLSLTDPDPAKRSAALEFITRLIDFGGQLGAPAILGSMQGKHGGTVPREQALTWLASALRSAGEAASRHGVPFIYEPLNRYETNLFNHAASACDFLHAEEIPHVVLLADLFHMAIEERDIAHAIREVGSKLGHVHWADSNRRAMGFGHTPASPIAQALTDIGYQGYLSAEVFPLPDADAAAAQTLISIRSCFP
jgi:sugar phosphate isomerase/epimerase